jgi:hypothetical protein
MCIRFNVSGLPMHAGTIGPFTDVMILVRSIRPTKSIETQHRLLGLLATLAGVPQDEDSSAGADIPDVLSSSLLAEIHWALCQFVMGPH